MTEIDKILNPDLQQSKVISLLSNETKESRQVWVAHNCTKMLIASLTGLIMQELQKSSLAETVDATALNTARKDGMVTALKLVLEEIDALNE